MFYKGAKKGRSLEEYVYGYVNFCLNFKIEITNKDLEELIDDYVKKDLELDEVLYVDSDSIKEEILWF